MSPEEELENAFRQWGRFRRLAAEWEDHALTLAARAHAEKRERGRWTRLARLAGISPVYLSNVVRKRSASAVS